MNIFNIKGFSSGDDDFSVGDIRPTQPGQSIVGRSKKPVSHEKPFEKYMEEPKEAKETTETPQESAMESPLLTKMGKTPAEMKLSGEMESLEGKSATPFSSSFPTKEAENSSVYANTSPNVLPETKKSKSSHKVDREPSVDSSPTTQAHSHVKKSSLGGEEAVGDEDIASIEHKKKTPDEVVWGAGTSYNKAAGDALGAGIAQKSQLVVEAVGPKSKLKHEVALEEDADGMSVESSDEAEESLIPVIGGEVKAVNVTVPHTSANISVNGVAPVEAKAPIASTSADLKSLIERIVSGVDTLTKGERMESVITLKQSPTLPSGFENATIRLTSVASARGEVNINFGGLTQSAVQLVQNNQADLLNALATRGVTVHIFSASTQQDPIAAQAFSSGNEQRQQQGFQQQEQQQQRRQQNQEEGEYT